MPCPDETTVQRFLSGELDERSRERVRTHLADCSPCCELFGALLTKETQKEASSHIGPRVAARAKDDPRTGTRLRRYRLDRPLGAGGMGIVYAAYDPELDRNVALKILWADRAAGDTGRLQREARAMAKLAHPNVVRVFDVGIDGDRVFLTMELVEGETMRDWMRRGPYPWREVLARFRGAAEGLIAAHRAGIVHRDFKPENLLLRRDGTVLVTDFGLAHEVPFGEMVATLTTRGEPEAANAVGTPSYMAPEQLRGERLDARVDVYAFSIALWEALYGARPFSPAAEDGLLGAIAKGPPAPPSKSDVPEKLRQALARGMAFRRRDRPLSIEELLSTLEDEKAGATWKRTAAIVGSAAVLLGLGTLGLGVLVGRASLRTTPPPPAPSAETHLSASTAVASMTATPTESGSTVEPEPAPPTANASTTPRQAASTPSPRTAPRASASAPKTRLQRGAIRGMDFSLYGSEAHEPARVLSRHAPEFETCWVGECTQIACRFEINDTGMVTRSRCSSFEASGACPAVEKCLADRIHELRFPPAPRIGESSVTFGN